MSAQLDISRAELDTLLAEDAAPDAQQLPILQQMCGHI